MDKQLAKILARLTALKNNLPQHSVGKKYADEYISIISSLVQTTGENLDEFAIPSSEIKPRVTSFNMLSGSSTYSSESYVDRDFLLMKIDGILSYYTILLQPTEIKNKIGFRVDEND